MNSTDPSAPISIRGTNGHHVLLIHSFTGTPAQVRLLGEELAAAGFGVTAPLLSGHGTELEDMARFGAQDWLDDVRTAAASVSDETLHVVGTSMGGLLGISLASELRARTMTLINTPVRFRKAKTYLAPVVKFVKPIHRWPEGSAGDSLPNPGYRVQYHGYSMSALASFVYLSLLGWQRASQVNCPTLVVQTRDDPDTHPSSARYITRRVAAGERSILWLDGDDHEALLSKDARLVNGRILEHLQQHSL